MAQKKSNSVCFCTPFLKLPPEKFLFGRKSNFSDAFLEKGEQKLSGLFRRTLLCRVPGKNYAGEGIGAVPCAR